MTTSPIACQEDQSIANMSAPTMPDQREAIRNIPAADRQKGIDGRIYEGQRSTRLLDIKLQAMQDKVHALVDLWCDFESARYSRNTGQWCQLFVRAFDFGRAYGDQVSCSSGEKPHPLLKTIKLGAKTAELDKDKQQVERAHSAWLASLPNAKVLMELASRERIWFEHYRFKPEEGGGWSVANSYWRYNVDHLRGLEDFERVLEMIRTGKRIGPLPSGYEYLDSVNLPESIRRALYANIADEMDQYLRFSPLWRWYTKLIWSLIERGVLLDDSQSFRYDDPTGLQFHQCSINSRP